MFLPTKSLDTIDNIHVTYNWPNLNFKINIWKVLRKIMIRVQTSKLQLREWLSLSWSTVRRFEMKRERRCHRIPYKFFQGFPEKQWRKKIHNGNSIEIVHRLLYMYRREAIAMLCQTHLWDWNHSVYVGAWAFGTKVVIWPHKECVPELKNQLTKVMNHHSTSFCSFLLC